MTVDQVGCSWQEEREGKGWFGEDEMQDDCDGQSRAAGFGFKFIVVHLVVRFLGAGAAGRASFTPPLPRHIARL